ncbi:MAG: glycosyltransferase family 2 protein [Flavisolibacter sp.]
MMVIQPEISIVIPTHNRSASLKRLLDKLAQQTFPPSATQVIVAADGCGDDTVKILQQYAAPFALSYIETPGEGPALARNKGAALARGSILLFLDDDIDPSEGMVAAHVSAHRSPDQVVIGYLPFAPVIQKGFFFLNLRLWWEQKFQDMRQPDYRYGYEDLLSGNVSMSRDLFQKVQGFDPALRCREDYELGIRLIKSRAAFVFSPEAWGYHRDEVTNLSRSLKRKRQEGRADVQFWHLHPDMTTSLQDAFLKDQYTFLRSKAVFFVIHCPLLTDIMASFLERIMHPLERFRFRKWWNKYNYKLHIYWYLRGLLDALHTRRKLNEYLRYSPRREDSKNMLDIDLTHGLSRAEAQLDQERPDGARIFFGEQLIGTIPPSPGRERLRGIHLRSLLAGELSLPFMKTIALESLTGNTKWQVPAR